MAVTLADTQVITWSSFSPSLNLSSVVSLEAWIYCTSFANQGAIIERFESSTIFYRMQISTGGLLQFQKRESALNTAGLWSSGSALSLNTLYHVVVVHDFGASGNVPVMYINNVLQSVTTNTAPAATGTRPNGGTLFLGHVTTTLTFLGNVYSSNAYNKLLSINEVSNNYKEKITSPFFTNPVFIPQLWGVSNGMVLGASNLIPDLLGFGFGTPTNNPVGKGDDMLETKGVN